MIIYNSLSYPYSYSPEYRDTLQYFLYNISNHNITFISGNYELNDTLTTNSSNYDALIIPTLKPLNPQVARIAIGPGGIFIEGLQYFLNTGGNIVALGNSIHFAYDIFNMPYYFFDPYYQYYQNPFYNGSVEEEIYDDIALPAGLSSYAKQTSNTIFSPHFVTQYNALLPAFHKARRPDIHSFSAPDENYCPYMLPSRNDKLYCTVWSRYYNSNNGSFSFITFPFYDNA